MKVRASARSCTSKGSSTLKVAVATSSVLAAEAAAETAASGGNAVDCAIAAALLTMNTEPGVCALAGGCYVTVWQPGATPLTIDGGTAIPGLESDARSANDGGTAVSMDYGGGVETIVGAASVAVPGSVAACDLAIRRYGALSWADTMAPSIRAARDGFPLPAACHHYLQYSGQPVFGRSDDGYAALHDENGSLRAAGDTVIVPHLADSLDALARGGADEFYRGELARKISKHVREGGGGLTETDLTRYRPIERPALQTGFSNWTLALNPPPAIGGAMLSAMLTNLDRLPNTEHAIRELIDAQAAAMRFRRGELDLATDIDAAVRNLLDQARSGELLNTERSSATVHTSAVDTDGLACAITSSAGYGSGEMPTGTGLWLNNCLGELELNRRGLDAGPPGSRLPSNMTPGIARTDDSVMAFGSPGADRITTALQQFLFQHLKRGLPLAAAISAPRLHVELEERSFFVAAEDDLNFVTEIPFEVQRYPALSMYFGGVGAACCNALGEITAAADPRRVGGVFVGV